MNKKIVKTVDVDGNELELAVFKPTAKQNSDASIVYSREWLKAEAAGFSLRLNLDKIAEKHGVWNDDMKKQVEDLEREMITIEKKLRAGSKFYKTLNEARTAALKLRKIRNERMALVVKKTALDEHTAESFAEKARLNYLLSSCVFYNSNGKPFFRDVNDYLERSEEKATTDATMGFMEIFYEGLLDYEKKYYENIFLKQHGFCDDKFRLINKQGQLIDEENRLLDENGRYIDSSGAFVDAENNPVDAEGNYIITFEPFVEENKEINNNSTDEALQVA